MNWYKVLIKGISGFLTGSAAVIAANPNLLTDLSGQKDIMAVGTISAFINSLANWYKNRERI